MFDIHREELDWGGRKLVLETGKIARQADGAVFATYGESTVLATVVSAKEPKAGIDFLPLTCNYQEKTYRSEEHTSELQSRQYLVCRLLLEKKKKKLTTRISTPKHALPAVTRAIEGSPVPPGCPWPKFSLTISIRNRTSTVSTTMTRVENLVTT